MLKIDLAELDARLAKPKKKPNFPQYLRENFAEFAKVVDRRQNWSVIAEMAFDAGLTGDKLANPETLKKAYYREAAKRRPRSITPLQITIFKPGEPVSSPPPAMIAKPVETRDPEESPIDAMWKRLEEADPYRIRNRRT